MIFLERILKHRDGRILTYVKNMREIDNLIEIYLTGPIDVNTVPCVCADLQGKFSKYLDRNILLDFSDVTHVDSATIANLILLIKELQQRHRKLGVIHVGDDLESFIELDKVRTLIHIYMDEEEALKDLSL